jgi:hypothetical protein
MPRFTIRTLIILTTAVAAYCSVITQVSGQHAIVWCVYITYAVFVAFALR